MRVVYNVAAGWLSRTVHRKGHVDHDAWDGDQRLEAGGVGEGLAPGLVEERRADAEVSGVDAPPRRADEGREQRGAQHWRVCVCAESVRTRALRSCA